MSNCVGSERVSGESPQLRENQARPPTRPMAPSAAAPGAQAMPEHLRNPAIGREDLVDGAADPSQHERKQQAAKNRLREGVELLLDPEGGHSPAILQTPAKSRRLKETVPYGACGVGRRAILSVSPDGGFHI